MINSEAGCHHLNGSLNSIVSSVRFFSGYQKLKRTPQFYSLPFQKKRKKEEDQNLKKRVEGSEGSIGSFLIIRDYFKFPHKIGSSQHHRLQQTKNTQHKKLNKEKRPITNEKVKQTRKPVTNMTGAVP